MNEKTVLPIKNIVRQTADTITLHFDHPPTRWNYLPGQFLTLILEIDGKEERRAYSLCSSPYIDEGLSVTIKRVRGGKMSNYLHEHIRIGDEMVVLPPAGNFTLDPANTSRHLVLIGCGSGITPLFSILKSALTKASTAKVSLIYVSPNPEKTIFYKDLSQWVSDFPSRLSVFYYWGDEWKKKVQGKAGFWTRLLTNKGTYAHRIDAARLQSIFNDLTIGADTDAQFYICGPQKLMEMAKVTIRGIGVAEDDIHTESFYNSHAASNSQSRSKQAPRMTIRLNGEDHRINVPAGKSVLFAGLEAGLDIPFSCQSGNCVSCAGKCLSGMVDMSTSEGLTQEQLSDGYVLTCVGYPKSEDVIIQFD